VATLCAVSKHHSVNALLQFLFRMLVRPACLCCRYLSPSSGLLAAERLHAPLLIDCSTIDPTTAREVATAAESTILCPEAAQNVGRLEPFMIDAPVSGGVPAAENKTLTFMCGGSNTAIEEATPFLLEMGRRVVRVGYSGSGCVAKLSNNLVLGISMAAVAEGLAWGQKQGIDPALLTDIFNTSSAQCWSSEKYNPVPGVMDGVPSSRGYEGGFTLPLMLKDLTLVLNEDGDMPLPMTSSVQKIYANALEHAGGNPLDFSSIYRLFYDGHPAGKGKKCF
jgi:3-hydroxyisobutyrate/3-hydroxypropionate dehydrogenase